MTPEIQELGREHHRAAAEVYADAFLHDPGWTAVGPRRERSRHTYIRRTCLSAMRVADRWCGPSWVVVEGGEPVAALVGCAPGKWPTPRTRSLLEAAPGPLLAGPVTLVRSLAAQRVFDQHHPQHEHFLVWLLAVSPDHQRKGHGRALMGRALAEADAAGVPAYLWTANPDNLPYYGSFGYEVFAESRIAGDTPNWHMERAPRHG